MSTAILGYRLTGTTGIHRGDRAYQQDQVEILPHDRVPGCLMAVLADGMGGKSGGRKAADQVLLTANQLFERYAPNRDDAGEALKQLVLEAHLMIKLTATPLPTRMKLMNDVVRATIQQHEMLHAPAATARKS